MKKPVGRFHSLMTEPLVPWTRLLLLGLAIPLALSFTQPLWSIHFEAPHSPQGLDLDIHAHKIEGDIEEINTLNFYIGMERIDARAFSELDWLPFAIGGLALLALRVAVVGDVRSLIESGGIADLLLGLLAGPLLLHALPLRPQSHPRRHLGSGAVHTGDVRHSADRRHHDVELPAGRDLADRRLRPGSRIARGLAHRSRSSRADGRTLVSPHAAHSEETSLIFVPFISSIASKSPWNRLPRDSIRRFPDLVALGRRRSATSSHPKPGRVVPELSCKRNGTVPRARLRIVGCRFRPRELRRLVLYPAELS